MPAQNDPSNNMDAGKSVILPETLPTPTAWPALLSLGVTLLAFGVVSSWIMSIAGLMLFVFSGFGWIGELTNEQS